MIGPAHPAWRLRRDARGRPDASAVGARGGGRPRLRRPVLAADRAAHPRLWGVLRAVAPSRPAGGGGQAQTARDHPLGRPRVGICARGAEPGAWSAGAWRAGARHLLRHAAAGPRPGRPGRAGGGGGVRPLRADRHHPGCPAGGHAQGTDVLDVSSRHRLRAAARLHRAGVLHGLAGRGRRGPGSRHLRHPVPPGGSPHALRPGDPHALPHRGMWL